MQPKKSATELSSPQCEEEPLSKITYQIFVLRSTNVVVSSATYRIRPINVMNPSVRGPGFEPSF